MLEYLIAKILCEGFSLAYIFIVMMKQ